MTHVLSWNHDAGDRDLIRRGGLVCKPGGSSGGTGPPLLSLPLLLVLVLVIVIVLVLVLDSALVEYEHEYDYEQEHEQEREQEREQEFIGSSGGGSSDCGGRRGPGRRPWGSR